MSNTTDPDDRRPIDWKWPLADVVSVLVFVTIGRINHAEGVTLAGIATTALPFLIALGAVWIVPGVARSATSASAGITVWVVVVALGMVLRHWVFGEGIAPAFIVVATVFLGFEFNGWRALVRAVAVAR